MFFGLLISGSVWCGTASATIGPRVILVLVSGVLAVLVLAVWRAVEWRQARAIESEDLDACCCAVGLLADRAHPLAHGLDCSIRRRYLAEMSRRRVPTSR